MSDLLPKLVAFAFCLIGCFVGLYFQRQERKQENEEERKKLAEQERRWTSVSVFNVAVPPSAADAMRMPEKPESVPKKPESGLASLQEQQQGGQQPKRSLIH
jgi:hypothetical protein